MKTLAGFVIVATAARAACLAVPGDKILARDLVPWIPLFQAADPESVIGFAPFPGTTRLLSSRDLLLAARRNGLAVPPSEPVPGVCVERVAQAVSAGDLRAALQSALAAGSGGDVTLEIIAFTNKLLPPGRLVFQLPGLNRPPANSPGTPVIWTGKLLYDGQSSLSVWAKVRLSVQRQVFLAKRAIPERALIRGDDIVEATIAEFPWPESPALSNSGIVGKIARQAIPAGKIITREALSDAEEVMRGDIVHVRVIAGAAVITLDAVSQSSGTKGEGILVHSLATGKAFRAVIEGHDHVVVDATAEPSSL